MAVSPVRFTVLVRKWLRLGTLGFGGPPAHIALLRQLCVHDNQWMSAEEFEHAAATTGLLPGPASTQLAIYCAWKIRGIAGGIIGGLCFIVPGFLMIVGLTAAFFVHHPSKYLLGAALGAGAVVPAIALTTALHMAPTSVAAVRGQRGRFIQWIVVSAAGLVTALLAPQYVVLTLLVCGVTSVLIQESNTRATLAGVVTTAAHAITLGGLGALSWVAFKVGALSYGGGFVIIPLMQRDVVSVYHWMTGAQFLNVVALGQITPGPVVLTTAAVGYAAHGLTGALVAASVAFAPSFLFILVGAGSFERIRSNARARAFLAGAAPCVIGAIAGSSIPLGLLLVHLWQLPLLAASLGWLLWRKGSSVTPLLIAAGLGALGALCLPV